MSGDDSELIRRLRENKTYKRALASVDEAQAKKISSMIEDWMLATSRAVEKMIRQAQTDPQYLSELREAVKGNDSLVIDSEPERSGSIGD